MTAYKQYSEVRIIRLMLSAEEYDGWHVNERSPQIGDTGTIVEILHTPGLSDKYAVESVGQGGTCIWLSVFDTEEIEPVL